MDWYAHLRICITIMSFNKHSPIRILIIFSYFTFKQDLALVNLVDEIKTNFRKYFIHNYFQHIVFHLFFTLYTV